jgi:hypothetical protein
MRKEKKKKRKKETFYLLLKSSLGYAHFIPGNCGFKEEWKTQQVILWF